jgi:AcrR family transcriptional regulator
MIAVPDLPDSEIGNSTDMPNIDPADDTRGRILKAAEQRIIRYGFGKTTMAEIAADCGMSAANLYRYFASKGDIAAAGAEQWLESLIVNMCEIADNRDISPANRLAMIVNTKLRALGDLVDGQPHFEELIEHVSQAREDIVIGHKAAMVELYARVIDAGLESGDFDVEDAQAAAEAFQAGTMGFFHHSMLCAGSFEDLRADAEKVVALLIRGLGRGHREIVSDAGNDIGVTTP